MRIFYLLLIFTCTSFSFGLFGQPYTFQVYSLSEGLPQSQVLCAFSDSRAYLWAGTAGGGLCRYDGERFLVFTTEDGLPSNHVRTIFQDINYRLWIGTSRGLCSYDGHSFSNVKGLNTPVNTLSILKDSTLLIGTNEGLYFLPARLDSITRFSSDTIGNVLSVFTQANTTWIGTTKGLWKMNSKSPPQFIAKMLGQGIYSITSADDNFLWLASWTAGIIRYDVAAQKIDTVFRDQLVLLPQCLFTSGNELWTGTQNNGLVHINLTGNQITKLDEKEGLPHQNVKAITPDASGQLWIATSGGGLAKCVKQNFRHYSKRDGLYVNRVYAVHSSTGKKLWLAVGNSTVQQFDDKGFHTFALDSLINGAKCKTIAGDPAGRIWIGTEGRGLVIISNGRASQISRQNGLPDDWIQKVMVDKEGTIWIATYTNGLASIQYDTTYDYTITHHVLPFKKLSSLFIDEHNQVWAGSNDGQLVCLENGKVKWKSTNEMGLPEVALRSLAFDVHDNLWIGTESRGVYSGNMLQETIRFQPIPSPFQLSSQNIYLMLSDPSHNIWVGTEKGVDKINFEYDGTIYAINSYGKNEGFIGIETCHDAAAIDDEGNVWFGTMNGLMRYTPGEEVSHHDPPVIHFENVSLFYKPIRETAYAIYASTDGGLRPGLKLSHNDNHLNFNFKAVDLNNPDQVVYRWKLTGADQDWSPPSEQPGVNYASLSPGSYVLQVQASSLDSIWSKPIEASFTIEAPYWQKKSFMFITGLTGIALVVALFYLWSKRLRKRERARREHLELQNKLLHLEQKALQLQMNPHFIFNALTSIKSLVSKEELTVAQEEINAFAQLMRGVLNNSRKQSISLAEEIAVLDKYLHIEQFCHQHKFEYTIAVADGIDTEEIEIPPMLLQPFVENAVVHGIAHLTHGGLISITFKTEGDLLVCTIRDNGKGREKAARLREEKKPGHQPVAVEVTRERLEAMQDGQKYVPLSIEDVQNENNDIVGTQVSIKMPMKGHW